MNRITLRFKSDSLEEKYQEEMTVVYNSIFKKMLIAYASCIGVPGSIISIFKWNLSDLIVYSLASLACVIYYQITTRLPKYYNILVTTLNVLSAILMGGQLYLFGPTIGINDTSVLFFVGASCFQLHITIALLNSNFLLSSFQLMLTILTYYIVLWSPKWYAYKLAFGVFIFFIVYFIYIIQKNRRDIFLLREYEKEWSQIVKKGLQQSIITAKKLLKLDNSNEFKDFTRRTLVFDNLKDYENGNLASKSVQRSQFSQIGTFKFDNKNKNTLENRIINILKDHIAKRKINNVETLQSIPLRLEKQGSRKSRPNIEMEKSYEIHQKQYQQQPGDNLFYGIFKQNENSKEQRISIKASTYQNQTDYFCCLVIEEETIKNKVKILEGINKNFEHNFFQLCLYVGNKLQDIALNIQNQVNIRANVSQCYNMIYNFKDHVSTIKNNFKMKFDTFIAKPTSLLQISEILISRFQNKLGGEFELKIHFVNCNSDLVLSTYTNKFIQVMMNLIENSIKFQTIQRQSQQRQKTYFSSHSQRKQKKLTQLIHSPGLKTSEFKQKNLIKLNPIFQTHFSEELEEKRSIPQATQNHNEILELNTSKQSVIMNEGVNNNTEEILSSFNDHLIKIQNIQTPHLTHFNYKEISINFELLKGESEASNIIKVTVLDQGRGMTVNRIIELLEIIGTKNPAFDSEYLNYNHLGWKVSYHIIGNLGPFYNFYIRNKENQGLEFHFYIFQNIEILQNNKLKQPKVFKNTLFQQYLEESDREYFNVQNTESFKERTRKQINDSQNIKELNQILLQQSIQKQSIIHQHYSDHIQLNRSNSPEKVESFSEQQVIETNFMSEEMIIPSINLKYNLSKLITEKKINQNQFPSKECSIIS